MQNFIRNFMRHFKRDFNCTLSENEDVGQSYMFKEKFINQP